jgi:hypothetical protein
VVQNIMTDGGWRTKVAHLMADREERERGSDWRHISYFLHLSATFYFIPIPSNAFVLGIHQLIIITH